MQGTVNAIKLYQYRSNRTRAMLLWFDSLRLVHAETETSILYVMYGEFDLCFTFEWQTWLHQVFIDRSEFFWKSASKSIVLMEYKV